MEWYTGTARFPSNNPPLYQLYHVYHFLPGGSAGAAAGAAPAPTTA
jgi:hypothetical protein